MSAYNELVGRLEAQTIVSKDGDLYRENRNPDGPEAAAAIRALEGEIERLRGLLLPEGFVAVPREPTEAMLAAAIPAIISMETRGDEGDAARADAAERSVRGPRQRLAAQYRAMIQAQETQG